MLAATSFLVDHLGPTVTCERRADGQILMFRTENGLPDTIDAWAEATKAALLAWPSDLPCGILHNFRYGGIQAVTQYLGNTAFNHQMQERLAELFVLRPQLKRYVALVMPDNFTADVTRLAYWGWRWRLQSNCPSVWETFVSPNAAKRWLLNNV